MELLKREDAIDRPEHAFRRAIAILEPGHGSLKDLKAILRPVLSIKSGM